MSILLTGGHDAGRPPSAVEAAISRRILERSRRHEGEEMRRSHWAHTVGALVLSLGLGTGCSDEASPVEPLDPIDPASAAEVLPSVDDAADRLQPGILDAAVAGTLSDHLHALQRHLASGDRSAAQDAVVAAAQLLAQYAAHGLGADAPDVTAIQLMLVHTATLIGAQLGAELVP